MSGSNRKKDKAGLNMELKNITLYSVLFICITSLAVVAGVNHYGIIEFGTVDTLSRQPISGESAIINGEKFFFYEGIETMNVLNGAEPVTIAKEWDSVETCYNVCILESQEETQKALSYTVELAKGREKQRVINEV